MWQLQWTICDQELTQESYARVWHPYTKSYRVQIQMSGLSGFCNSIFYRENQHVLTPRILSRWTKKESRSHEYDENEDWRKETKRIILRSIFPESHDVGELGIDPELFEVAGEAALSALLRSFIFFLLPHGFSNSFTSFFRQQSADMGFCDILQH